MMKKKMTTVIALLLVFGMVAGLTGCGTMGRSDNTVMKVIQESAELPTAPALPQMQRIWH